MPKAGYVKTSQNLDKRIKVLDIATGDTWKAAFMDSLIEYIPQAKVILAANALEAMEASEEFNTPLFADVLLTLIQIDELYVVIPVEQSQKVTVTIDAATYFGDPANYWKAVDAAKAAGGFGKGDDAEKASYYWRVYLYQPAREGTSVKSEKTTKNQIEKYWNTMSLRMAGMEDTAPWWYLLENGNIEINVPGREGTPYPEYGGQKFIEKSERAIKVGFEVELARIYDEYLNLVEEEGVEADKIAEEIAGVVSEIEQNPASYVPGDVIKRITEKGRDYVLYVTSTGQLGHALASRYKEYLKR